MGIFDKFKKKEVNRVDQLANKLMKEGKVSLLESELKKMNASSLSENEKEAWYEMYGIDAFQRKDRLEALKRYQEAYEKYPDSPSIAFGLGQEYQHIGNVERMIELFDKAPFPKVSAKHVICEARYCYLWNRHDKAIEYLSQFLKCFYELKTADDTRLYIRGLPFYSEVWSGLGASFELTNNLEELKKITCESKNKLSDYRFDDLILFLECIKNNGFDRILERNVKRIIENKKHKLPFGYPLMQIGVLRALITDKSSEAEKILDEVEIAKDDFQWLKDIGLLAKCSLANKFGDVEKEGKLKKEFFSKQPLLFEPEYAFDFRLVSYQELLKKDYQERAKSFRSI